MTRMFKVLVLDGVQNYIMYADAKLAEEEARGRRYLESTTDSVEKVFLISYLFFICPSGMN